VTRKQGAELAKAAVSQTENTKRSQTIEQSWAFFQNAVARIAETNRRETSSSGVLSAARRTSIGTHSIALIAKTNPLREAEHRGEFA
jgi:hypothetical protein